MPRSGIEARQLAIGEGVGAPGAVGRALQRRIVQQEADAVARELHIEFESAVPKRCAEAECRQGVFRRQLTGTTMGNHFGIRPGGQ